MTYEVGKTYRTVGGTTAQLLNDHGGGHTLPYRISVRGRMRWADCEGNFADDRMLPGAIEDEPQAVSNQANDPTAILRILESHQKQIDELRERWSPAPPPRTLKGKWLNVYRADTTSSDNYWLGGPFDTRADALASISTARIACIQIPDIQEGEGL